jgi:hypothetical protein
MNNEKLSYDDIYYYLDNYDENTNSGKYSENFKLNNKGFNYHDRKQMFCHKCKKFIIDDKKCLLKSIKKFNALTKSKIIKTLYVVPPKYINEIIHLYHIYSGHKGYHNLAFLINNEGYYIKGIYIKIKKEIKECIICNQNKKNIIKKPIIMQIIPKGPRYE